MFKVGFYNYGEAETLITLILQLLFFFFKYSSANKVAFPCNAFVTLFTLKQKTVRRNHTVNDKIYYLE